MVLIRTLGTPTCQNIEFDRVTGHVASRETFLPRSLRLKVQLPRIVLYAP